VSPAPASPASSLLLFAPILPVLCPPLLPPLSAPPRPYLALSSHPICPPSPLPFPPPQLSHGSGGRSAAPAAGCHSAPRAARSRSNNRGAGGGVTAGSPALQPGPLRLRAFPVPDPQPAGGPSAPAQRPGMKPCEPHSGAQRRRRARVVPAMRARGCAALWALLLAQVGPAQVSPVPPTPRPSRRSPPALPASHRGVAAVFQQAPACAPGPAAAAPGSPRVPHPLSSAEQPGWLEKGGKSGKCGLLIRQFSSS
jgi:hypothetical protein